MQTTIIDYGAGNIRSVQNTLDELGAFYRTTNEPDVVDVAEQIILPGVGHFGQMMGSLDQLGLRTPILNKIKSGTPFLGICVGLQCLFEGSEESPGSHGLGVFPGLVKRFGTEARVPHMGWNSLTIREGSRLLQNLGPEPFTYFAHSYYAPVIESTAAVCEYINPYSAALERGNVFAVQFHPEKSGAIGLEVIRNFLTL